MACITKEQMIKDLTKLFLVDLKTGNTAHGLGKSHSDMVAEAKSSAIEAVEAHIANNQLDVEATVDKQTEADTLTMYHGTNKNVKMFINKDGDLQINPAKNFDGKTLSVSFTHSKDTAFRYASQIKGGGPEGYNFSGAYVFKIKPGTIKGLERESSEEFAVNTTSPVIIPKESFEIVHHKFSSKLSIIESEYNIDDYINENYDDYEREQLTQSDIISGYIDSHIAEEDGYLADDIYAEMKYLNEGNYKDLEIKSEQDMSDDDVYLPRELLESMPEARRIHMQGNKKVPMKMRIGNVEYADNNTLNVTYYTAKGKQSYRQVNRKNNKTVGGESVWAIDELMEAKAKIEIENKQRLKIRKAKEKKYPTLFSQSATEKLKRSEAHKEYENKIWNNPKHAIKLFDDLNEIDGTSDTEYTRKMKTLLEDITNIDEEILNKFKVYINKSADKNSGVVQVIDGKSEMILDVTDGSNTVNGDMTAVETYMHELIHLSIEYARMHKKGAIYNSVDELMVLHEQVKKEIKWQDLVVDGNEQQAKDTWNHMFEGKNGLSEFVAIGLTNEKMIEVLSKITPVGRKEVVQKDGMWNWLAYHVVKIYEKTRDLVRTSHGIEGDERLRYLAGKLWEHNSDTINKNRFTEQISGVIEKGFNTSNTIVLKTIKTAVALASTGLDRLEASGDKKDFIPTSARLVRELSRVINPWQSKMSAKFRNLSWTKISIMMDGHKNNLGLGGIFAPESTIMSLLNFLGEDDKLTTIVERFGIIVQKLDRERAHTIIAVGKVIKNAFNNKISHKEQNALTTVFIENDIQSITKEYSLDQINEMLKDETKLNKAIDNERDNLDKIITDKNHRNYIKNQTIRLGHFMATNISGSAVEKTASDILYMNSASMEAKSMIKLPATNGQSAAIKIIDRLASLEAIKRTESSKKVIASNLIDKSRIGVETAINIHKLYNARLKTFESDSKIKIPRSKGDIKDTKESHLDVTIASGSEKSEARMKKKGWKKVGDAGVKGLVVYRKITISLKAFDKQAVAKINEGKRLQSIIGVINKEDPKENNAEEREEKAKALIAEIKKSADADVLKQMNEIWEPKDDEYDGYIHMIGYDKNSGEYGVMNYGVSIDKTLYHDKLRQDKKAPVLLGKMIAEVNEKADAKALNKKVYKTIINDMKNYKRSGVESDLYIEIGPDAKTHRMTETSYSKELFENMPNSFRHKILSRTKGQQYIAVRRDLAPLYFGSRMPDVLDMRIPLTKGKTIRNKLKKYGADEYVEKTTELAGYVWSEAVSIQKVDIVIKTPEVLIDNIRSNFNYIIALGMRPDKAFAQHFAMTKATKQYLDSEKELKILHYEIMTNSKGDKVKLERIALLKNRMSENPVAPLMIAGLFTSIVEDISDADFQAESKFKILEDSNGAIKYIADNTPQMMKDGFNTVYMNQDTGMFQTMMTATQYGDFVARVIRYIFLTEEKGFSPAVAMKIILDDFGYYNRIDSGLLKWLSRYILRFFKYVSTSNKSMIEKLKTHPTQMLMLNALIDSPNPSDSSLIEVDWSNKFYGPLDTMVDGTVEHILPPSMLELVYD